MVNPKNNKQAAKVIKAKVEPKATDKLEQKGSKAQAQIHAQAQNGKEQCDIKAMPSKSCNAEQNHKYNIFDFMLQGYENIVQNNKFAKDIADSYVTNLGLLCNDVYTAFGKYTDALIKCKNIEDLKKTNENALKLSASIAKQANVVNVQTMLDCCNEIVSPSFKQVAGLAEQIKKSY